MLLPLLFGLPHLGNIPSLRDNEYRLALLIHHRFERIVNSPKFITFEKQVLHIMYQFALRGISNRGLESALDICRVAPTVNVPKRVSDYIVLLQPDGVQRCLICIK